MELNEDQHKRDELLKEYFTDDKYSGGIRHFDRVPKELMAKLIEEKFADPEDNGADCAPTIGELMAKDTELTFSGYTVEIQRNDYRVSVDAVHVKLPFEIDPRTMELINEFHSADEFEIEKDELWAWWD